MKAPERKRPPTPGPYKPVLRDCFALVQSFDSVLMVFMTESQLNVSLAELRRSFDLLLSHVEATDDDVVRLETGYFWPVPPDELYDVEKVPVNLTIGQVSECWQHLTDLLADPDRALSYHLVWLSEVLRAIGQKAC